LALIVIKSKAKRVGNRQLFFVFCFIDFQEPIGRKSSVLHPKNDENLTIWLRHIP
jgi:hypothetical protein